MIKYNPYFFILTGGPGAGKTSVVNELHKQFFTTVTETGRYIIKEQLVSGGEALPWKNRLLFAHQMLQAEKVNYLLNYPAQQPVIFDRGIPDVLGYLQLSRLYLDPPVEEAVLHYRYNKHVFIFPPWKTIYQNDQERKQDYLTAVDTYLTMKEIYDKAGYKLIEVPKRDITTRTAFIMYHIKRIIM
ncbi:AAA family ATPase [Olivibacter sp. SDN3]|nr:AAA family ATPase [Olivibacter sp. SDN3]